MITKDELAALLSYDPKTGCFTWIVDKGRAKAGSVAGHISKSFGYRLIKIGQHKWQAHRLAFVFMEGALPPNQVDHINQNRADNRWANLRHATHKQNHENRTTHEMRGIRFETDRGKWLARIKSYGVCKNLGRFTSLHDAIKARRLAEKYLFTHSPSSPQSSYLDDSDHKDDAV